MKISGTVYTANINSHDTAKELAFDYYELTPQEAKNKALDLSKVLGRQYKPFKITYTIEIEEI